MNIIIYLLLALFYAASTVLILRKREWLIYLMCFTSVFYDSFDIIFLHVNLLGLKFFLKPFLFFQLLLIFLCLLELLNKKRLQDKLSISNKAVFICFFVFATMAAYNTFAAHSSTLVGINLILMVSMAIFLPYYYADKKFNLNIALCSLLFGLILSYTPVLYSIIGHTLFSMQEPSYSIFKIYGLTYVLGSFFIIYFYLIARKPGTVIFLSIFLFLCFYMVFMARSRASWLTLFLCLLVYLIVFFLKAPFMKASGMKITWLYMIIALAFFSSVLTDKSIAGELMPFKNMVLIRDVVNNDDPFMANIHNKFLRFVWYYLAHERTIAWREAIHIIKANPYRGYGLIFSPAGLGVHNTLFTVFLSTGIAGFLFYISGIFILFGHLLKNIWNNLMAEKMRLFYFTLMLSIIGCGIDGTLQTNINEYLPWFLIAVSFVVLKGDRL